MQHVQCNEHCMFRQSLGRSKLLVLLKVTQYDYMFRYLQASVDVNLSILVHVFRISYLVLINSYVSLLKVTWCSRNDGSSLQDRKYLYLMLCVFLCIKYSLPVHKLKWHVHVHEYAA